MNKILITGATGQLGKLVVDELLKKVSGNDISILVRQFEKADDWKDKGIRVLQGDYNDYRSLLSAFQNTEKLYFISSNDKEDRFGQHTNVVNAAVEARVGHLIYTSAHRKSDNMDSLLTGDAHWQTDALIKSTGITFTILKHSLYTELLPLFMGSEVLKTGSIVLPAGNGRSSYATRPDLAAAGAIVLTSAGHENKTYDLSSPVSISFQDVAAIMSELSGKNMTYKDVSSEDYLRQVQAQGVPDRFLKGVMLFCNALKRGEFDFPSLDLKLLLCREPQSVKMFLKTAYNL
ncbi:SDR family oxidoreductase [Mucilaginibacter sp. KACC 22773]|uniref:SDR family oxidoreductase n=1 Tax=Mucilaginibacter sp. KACC 22773 TaxID=3025671 RepID=UPI002366B484|nr:SDR family oxidoreductase [Mucilaginibacter sp. KACC 22773]WDF81124.1 SDR family oxidoreductase [Mucilaginibacter sp. KACC 22773]